MLDSNANSLIEKRKSQLNLILNWSKSTSSAIITTSSSSIENSPNPSPTSSNNSLSLSPNSCNLNKDTNESLSLLPQSVEITETKCDEKLNSLSPSIVDPNDSCSMFDSLNENFDLKKADFLDNDNSNNDVELLKV